MSAFRLQRGTIRTSVYFMRRLFSSKPSWAMNDPVKMSAQNIGKTFSLLNGEWINASTKHMVIDPINGNEMIESYVYTEKEVTPFVHSLTSCPKYGLHNPFYNVERYVKYGEISHKAAVALNDTSIADYFAKLIQRVSPKSYVQAMNEVKVTAKFLENFSGDRVRFLARAFSYPGDHQGQSTNGYFWPYGPVTIISPFNFPLEIPVLQLMGALYMGNKVLLKNEIKVAIVMDEFLRLLHYCGMPKTDVDSIYCKGNVMHEIILRANPRMTLFTGSARVAELLAKDLKGRLKMEDAGFDWKILGPDVANVEYVAYTCDQDAYACSGQKCSAQSILFIHKNWDTKNFIQRLSSLAKRRQLEDLTIGPVLTVKTKDMLDHMNELLKIPGAYLAFGGKELENHSIPECYGAIEPTAVYVPLKEMIKKKYKKLVTREIFGPFQIITDYEDSDINTLLHILESMDQHLTAAVVSNDQHFTENILAHTVNGTTYYGIRARTTGAPQNHWFGPAGDPRGGGIGTPEAIQKVWACHRELIKDTGPISNDWKVPPPS